MAVKILIVEDDKKLNDGICLALKNDSYLFYQCRTLHEAREVLNKEDMPCVMQNGLWKHLEILWTMRLNIHQTVEMSG